MFSIMLRKMTEHALKESCLIMTVKRTAGGSGKNKRHKEMFFTIPGNKIFIFRLKCDILHDYRVTLI